MTTRPRQAPPGVTLPSDWSWTRLGIAFRHVDERSTTGTELLLSVTKNGVVPRDQITDRPARADTLIGYKRCCAGDLIVNQMSVFDGLMGVTRWDGLVTYHYLVFRPSETVDARYFTYALTSETYQQDFARRVRGLGESSQKGVRTPHIRISDMLQTLLPLPPLAAQRAIADYLDTETARIDALITKKRRMIKVLDEARAALMLAAVGGGLTHNGRFEESTLAWLGERPSHWDEVLLRLIARTGSGHTPSRERPEWWVNCTIPWITTGEVAQVRSDEQEVIVETRERISELGIANSSATIHPAGTVVLCRTASAGYSAIMGEDMATSQDFATWTCGPLLRPRFLLLCLRAMRPDLLGRLATGSTHKTIYMPDLHALRVPLPPVAEQDAIVDICQNRLNHLFAARHGLDRQIDLLVERRQALITAAVTGELTVPAAA